MRKGLDGLGEIAVGTGVATDESSIDRQHRVTIDMEELFHREFHGCGEFHDTQMSSGLQHAAHLLQTLVEIGKVTDAESCGDGVETAVGVGEGQTVFLRKGNNAIETFLSHFLTPYLHHSLTDIGSDEPLWM